MLKRKEEMRRKIELEVETSALGCRSWRALFWRAASMILFSVFVIFNFSVFANEQVGGTFGKTVNLDGSENPNGDDIYTFTNTNGVHQLTIDQVIRARILVVGGGGAGASSGNAGSGGGAGGGGAGGLVHVASTNLLTGVYSIQVGAAGINFGTSNLQGSGASGKSSTISCGGNVAIEAFGGGGGGRASVGLNGGSGGGGSRQGTTKRNGGTGVAGQGFAGGASEHSNVGAGGGGAGGVGGDTTGTAATGVGVGGLGVSNDITGREVEYAKGGGGNHRTATTVEVVSGQDGLGQGGSGGNKNVIGGKGGSGIVIIRVLEYMPLKPAASDTEKTVDYDSLEHEFFVPTDQMELFDADNNPVDRAVATDVGDYYFTVKPKGDRVWGDGTTDAIICHYKVKKPTLVISSFTQEGWQAGEEFKKPKIASIPVLLESDYQLKYALDIGALTWTTSVPSVAGNYRVKLDIFPSENFELPAAMPEATFTVTKWEEPAVDISALGYYSTMTVVNDGGDDAQGKDVEIKISEQLISGFLYSQANADGSDIRFMDLNGNLLSSKVNSWDPTGISTLTVRMNFTSGAKIIMFWGELVVGDDEEPLPDVPGGVADAGPEAFGVAFSWDIARMRPNSYFKNRWIELATISKFEWRVDDALPTVSAGKSSYGDAIYVFENISGEYVTNAIPNKAGEYRFAAYTVAGADANGTRRWTGLENHVSTISITPNREETEYADLGDATATGRTLLVNDYDDGSQRIDDQSIYNSNGTARVYWTHSNFDSGRSGDYPNLLKATRHTFSSATDIPELCGSKLIWDMYSVLVGNHTLNNNIGSSFNYLPNSSFSKPSLNPSGEVGLMAEAGELVFRNDINSVIYSPCYTNGIGTIYFDAVNIGTHSTGEGYKLILEYATNCVANGESLIPSDENIHDIQQDPDDTSATITNMYANVTNWVAAKMLPLKREATDEFIAQTETSEVALAINQPGTANNFYRICVPVNYYGPIRFRLRRSDVASSYSTDAINGLIAVDNIIVSYPPSRVDLEPKGQFDGSKTGKETRGYEGAFMQPYPSIKDNVIASAKPIYTIASNDSVTDPRQYIVSAKMHYRWRYLDQEMGAWQFVGLDPNRDFAATEALNLPEGLVGDVEFYYETALNASHYGYFDYSGAKNANNAPLRLSGLYEELLPTVINRSDSTVLNESRGTDWFVRLREGVSDVASINLLVRDQISGVRTIAMELVDNHVWRGYLSIPTNLVARTGTQNAEYQIEILNRQTPGSSEYSVNTNYWFDGENAKALPISTSLVVGDETKWTPITLDSRTGYFLFQMDDENRSLTILHADYQNFNEWGDAKGDKFVGTSTLNEHKVGTAPTKQLYRGDFYGFLAMPELKDDWCVPSTAWTRPISQRMGNREPYKPFPSDTSGAWRIGQGQWISKWYREDSLENIGVALQMEGQGKGYVEITSPDYLPRGLKSLTFNARLAQAITFDDFSYYDADRKNSMSNYTFITRAAFDTNSNLNFSGNASLSLVTHYRPGVGCYEFRVEQLRAENISGKRSEKGIALSFYRWAQDSATRKLAPTMLGTKKYLGSDLSSLTMQNTIGEGTDAYYTPMYFSISNDATSVYLSAGVCKTGLGTNASVADFAKDTMKYCGLEYRDSAASRLKTGTYGVLSANCEGLFIGFFKLQNSVKIQSSPAANELKTFTDKSGTEIKFTTTSPDAGRAQVEGDWWVTRFGRMSTFSEIARYGVRSDANLVQSLTLYTAPAGMSNWEAVKTFEIKGFGSSTSSGDHCSYIPYSPDSKSLRLAINGDIEETRLDIAIHSLEARQWAGVSWDQETSVSPYVSDAWGTWQRSTSSWGLTNFIFSTAWTVQNGVMLSAKRANIDTPVAIRSPLMDGYELDMDGNFRRGTGLGVFSFAYTNAHPATVLHLQIATNRVSMANIGTLDKIDDSVWTTLKTYNFAEMTPQECTRGTLSEYIGLHGVTGVMRLVMSTNVIADAKLPVNKDKSDYGSITITKVTCRDEPMLDDRCWWGWNLRTVGTDNLGRDDEGRMYLPDLSSLDPEYQGLSLALNSSVSRDIDEDQSEEYKQHMPFVQTPTFGTNLVGSVMFRARRYKEPYESAPAYVAIYGCKSGLVEDDTQWEFCTNIAVSATTYANFNYTTDPGKAFAAFRLAVTDVEGVLIQGEPRPDGEPATRVLIDEILVSEALRPRMAFRNIGAFHSGMSTTGVIANVPSKEEQPLCNEGWGVQCEIFPAQLADEINFDRDPIVVLHWFTGIAPWGFENWRTNALAKSARLSRAKDTENLVYRSSYISSPDAVIPMTVQPGTVVQYFLEVRYWQNGSAIAVTNYMERGDWTRPDWYRPIDYNEGKEEFSAFSILDTVSPGWAWINEVNIFGDFKDERTWENTEKNSQFVEVAAPQFADLTGWSLRMVGTREDAQTIVTNIIAQWGTSKLPGVKKVQTHAASNMLFHVIASPLSQKSLGGKLDPAEGEIDGTWSIKNIDSATAFTDEWELGNVNPVGIQLVRPNGVIEHEIVAIGTNYWGSLSAYADAFSLDNTVDYLNEKMKESRFFIAGDDAGKYPFAPDRTRDASLSVMSNFGASTENWTNLVARTPGRVNEGQIILGEAPTPNGETIIIYANVDNDVGHLRQTVGDVELSNESQMLIVRRGSSIGTNIVYTADNWHQLDVVTTNGTPIDISSSQIGPREYRVTVGVNVSNNVTVVARARMDDSLRDYGLTNDNPYTPAILDWLMKGKTLRGDFANPLSDEIKLAKFWRLISDTYQPMTLTQMYWFDMDPTVGDLALGMTIGELPHPLEFIAGMMTNVRMSVKMYITNQTDNAASDYYGKAWTPYVIRGLTPGEHSQNYSGAWTSATFKVSSFLATPHTSMDNEWNWVTLRMFLFNDDSFLPLDDPDHPAEAFIEVMDPFSKSSPGYTAGYYDWVLNHPENPRPTLLYKFNVNEKMIPYAVDMLCPTNYFTKPTPID